MNGLKSISWLIQASTGVSENRNLQDRVSAGRLKRVKLSSGILLFALVIGSYWFLSDRGLLDILMDQEMLQVRIERIGLWGPLMVVGLIACAIVFSPLPSAPLALAAGAAFGHTYGTLYVLIGSVVGAMAAFTIARLLGHDILHKWLGNRFPLKKLPGGQNTLMGVVFVSRLIPFISFDSISYIAGLTSLTFWRFVIATLGGIIPASFLLAHFGSKIVEADAEWSMTSVLMLGGITIVPFVIAILWKRIRWNSTL